jgi:hypothetical protein
MCSARPLDDSARSAVTLVIALLALIGVHFHGSLAWSGTRLALFGWFAVNFTLLFLVPALVVRCVFRESLSSYGLTRGRSAIGRRDVRLAFVILAPLAILATRLPSIQSAYPIYSYARNEPWLLLPSTLGWGAYFFSWEFFFRGFILFGVGRQAGPSSIFVQLVPFVLAHLPKGELETLAAIPGGIVFGLIAWRGRSFLGTWILHWALATLVNLVVLAWPSAP